ncbi:MAG: alpha-N-arabinofuranosidase [Mesorhizobium sp.]|uniref:arabinosylfuranosidase ArfA n=1 Tax=Mesorhizobium sp. TaxID=1871066 RepID=UPI000FE522CB|nr:alpha-N-arabinofuranosidase [Mesorhizobium sp.]RWA77329.1 MAG: alpha-N-arabinofuranosidase [Mesorhizobium sp.]RWC05603.1 MAG: alpha-N-arabinofuranosidase [Mesorhizobium sp.]
MKAHIAVHRDFKIGTIDDRIYSAFLEHLGRAVYGGIYEPGHATADEDGFRGDVLELVRGLNAPLVRYPGGNFVSNYDWLDGIGPKNERPVRLDYAWKTTETNEMGTDEFIRWCRKAGTEPMLAVNLGSKGFTEALAMLEYCNHPGGSYWSDLRRKNGSAEPHNVRVWCLGNEMDGPWQMNHRTAHEYGRVANEVGRAMKVFDPTLELVACGSSNHNMPTYPAWEAEVLELAYDNVDYISLHQYWDNWDDDYLNFLAKSVPVDRYIQTISGVIDYVKAKRRSKHNVYISFDEWNVWYHTRKKGVSDGDGVNWAKAPSLLEDAYNFEDVLLVGCALNTFIRRSDRVRIACIAQLVNVIAPIMTQTGGPAWKQTIYYPYYYASLYGRGDALNVAVDVPTYDAKVADDVPYLDVAAVRSQDGATVAFFMVNRHPDEALAIDIDMAGFAPKSIAEHVLIAHPDLKATNTAAKPDRVSPRIGDGVSVIDGRVKGNLPPRSYHLVRVSV